MPLNVTFFEWPWGSGWRQSIGSAILTSRALLSLGPAYAMRPVAQLLVAPGDEAIAATLLAALTLGVLEAAIVALGRSLPWLPADGTIPAAGGIFRGGSPDVYNIVVIEAES